ncbi:hypothetical protein BVX97_01870 [bacterium E08(2017)]|nr:hypothetical protein BVX97_01870 [bacterium E08(2017)]
MKDSGLIFDLATGFWKSSVLFTALDFGVFDLVDTEDLSLWEIAQRLQAAERGMAGLLDSCVALGLLRKEGDAYCNTEAASKYLTSRSPESLVITLRMQASTYPMWGQLRDAVASGEPVLPPSDILGSNMEMTRHFVYGMHQRAVGAARALVDAVDLSGRKVLADIGGGPGTYSVLLTEKFEGLKSKVLDLGPIIAVSRELIEEAGAQERVETVAFDAKEDELPDGFDAALISGFLHRLPIEGCERVIKNVYDKMDPGGVLIVSDLFANWAGDGPEMAILFGLQMLLVNDTGSTHGVNDIVSCFDSAGFKDVSVKELPPPLPYSVVSGFKPA